MRRFSRNGMHWRDREERHLAENVPGERLPVRMVQESPAEMITILLVHLMDMENNKIFVLSA